MTPFDWIIIGVYLVAMIAFSYYVGRKQESAADYYVGGRNLPWWALGISTMATQSSAISFISIPAFVALKPGGGVSWLQYEMAVPLAMIVIMATLVPVFRGLKLVSVYEYLEYRFSPATRTFMSLVFLISRGFGTGIGVYGTAIVLTVALDVPVWQAILLIGVVTIIYDTIGGMAAVVYSDVLQMFILVAGLLICIFTVAQDVGGFAVIIDALAPERWEAFNFETGLFDQSQSPFFGFLFGGFFLYASYYGTDQSQTQRILSSPSVAESKKALLFNGIARFPLTLAYLALGLAAAAAFVHMPELASQVPAEHPDYLIPRLIIHVLPPGLRAVLIAALLAAAMSSLDSSLNSVSAVTMKDFIEKWKPLSGRQHLNVSRLVTVIWGVIITATAFFADAISQTVIEAVNKVGSAFYGPMLAAFLLGIFTTRVNAFAVIISVTLGVVSNLWLWVANIDVHWMWWNLFGFIVTMLVAIPTSFFGAPPTSDQINRFSYRGLKAYFGEKGEWNAAYLALALYFVMIMATATLLSSFGA